MKPRRRWQSDSHRSRKRNGRLAWRRWLHGLEQLEARRMLASVSWTGTGNGVDWTDSNNWSTHAVPGPADDVTINIQSNAFLHIASGTQSINSLVCDDKLIVFSGATLQVATTASFDSNSTEDFHLRGLTLEGGTLLGGTYSFNENSSTYLNSESGTSIVNGVMFSQSRIECGPDQGLNSNLIFLNGFNDTNGRLDVLSGEATFGDTTHAAGSINGNVVVDMAGGFLINGSGLSGAAGTLTIPSTVTFLDGIGFIENNFSTGNILNQTTMIGGGQVQFTTGLTLDLNNLGTIENQGTMSASPGSLAIGNFINDAGATVTVDGSSGSTATLYLAGSLNNQGTINVTDAGVTFAGDFSQAQLGTFNRSGGTINVTGTIEGDLNLNASTGSWNVSGRLNGGTVTTSGGAAVNFTTSGGSSNGAILDNETINGDLNLTVQTTSYLYVIGSLNVTGTITLGNAAGTTSAQIYLGTGLLALSTTAPGFILGNATLTAGNIVFGGSNGNGIFDDTLVEISQPGPNDPPAAATYFDGHSEHYYGGGPATINGPIQGGVGSIYNFFSYGSITIGGTVTSGASGAIALGGSSSLGVGDNTLINNGTLQATSGGSLTISGLVNHGTVSANSSGLTLSGPISNASTITATNSTVTLQGTFAQADLGNFTDPGSIVNLSGTLEGGLTLNASTGSWYLHQGTVDGGTISESGGAELAFTQFGGTLKNGVVFDGDMDLAGNLNQTVQGSNIFVNVYGGLTLNGNMFVGGAAGGSTGEMYFGNNLNLPGSLLGSGTVIFGARSVSGDFLENGWSGAGSQTLTIGPNITIRGQNGSIVSGGSTPVVIEGTVSADIAGGTIQVGGSSSLGAFGTALNEGSIQAINGAAISATSLTNPLGHTITATGSTLTFSGAWSNAGTITVSNSTVNLGGTLTQYSLGTFNRTGGTVNLTGTLSGGLVLTAATGSWVLAGGTIQNGITSLSGGARLILNLFGGKLVNETVDGNIDATAQSATVTVFGGLVLNGTLSLGSAASNAAGSITFGDSSTHPPGTLSGNGTIVLGQSGSNFIGNGSAVAGSAGTLTIGPSITIEGSSGTIQNASGNGTIVFQGNVIADAVGGNIRISDGAGNTIIDGSVQAQGGTIISQGSITLGGTATLTSSWQGSFNFSGASISGSSTGSVGSNLAGTMTLGGGTPSNPILLEAMSEDEGLVAAGFKHNFNFGTLSLSPGGNVKLIDQSDNAPGSGAEAVYANAVIVPSAATLNLNGLNMYVRADQVSGTVINGTISVLPDGGAIDVNDPLPGAISPAGNQDTWTFFGRAGETITAYVNPGTGNAPAPISPTLNFANIQLVAPDHSVLASGNSSTNGAAVSLANITLPTDGVYSIKISAATGHTSSTGNYDVAVWDVTPQIQPLLLGQNTNGSINTPFDVQQWTFTALANEQVKFHLISETSSGLAYTLTGPGGFTGFTNITGDSSLVTLPASGTYTLSVDGTNGATGNYAFVVNPTTVTTLPLNGLINGTLAGSDQAELFTITVPAEQALQVSLNDSTNSDSNELYLKFGSPPTREDYDYRYSSASAADQSILVPKAAIGTWYVLVYTDQVPVASNFTLSAEGLPLVLTASTPGALGNSAPETLSITGAGFEPGAVATLIGPGNTQIAATATSVVSYSQLTATFPEGIAAGTYSIKVTSAGSSDTLPGALTITAGGSADLETSLQLPAYLGRHIGATLYVTYANDGTVAMPAPLLVLSDPLPLEKPLLTLDPSKISAGLYTSSLPDGYSNSIQILANGKISGVLLPGESITVPIYYAGMQQPWDFTDGTVPFNLSVIQTSDTDAIDWNSLKSQLQPPDVSAVAWNQIFPNLTAQFGTTDGQYVAALDANATYLAGLGENVNDVGQLSNFMYLQANDNFGPVDTLTSVTDTTLPLPAGEALEFSRQYNLSISARDSIGILGFGWTNSDQSALSFQADGSVDLSIGVGGLFERFQPDTRGGYFSPDQTLTLTANPDGSYTLLAGDGSLENFAANGTLAYTQDTNGNRTTLNYNASSQLVGIVASSGQSLTLAYNAAGRLSSVTDSDGRITTYSYDATNQYLLSVTGPGGTTSYTYDPASNALSSIANPDGTHQFFTYDAQSRLASTAFDGNVGAVAYSYNAPGEISATDALGNVSQTDYNAFGQLVKVVDGLGNPAYFTYDGQSNLLSATDAVGDTTSYVYGATGNLTSITDPLHAVTTFTYGADSRPASLIDPDGNLTRYGSDAHGNLVTTSYADGTQETYSYDPLGNALSFVNRNGQTTSYTYNSSGQLTKQTFADGSHDDYTYDAHNNLLTATDATGATTFTYDSADRLTSVSYPGGKSLTFTYDAGGRRTKMVDQTGYTVNYVYTPAGELQKLTDTNNNPIVTYTYDADGRMMEQDNANGTSTTYQYDAAGNVTHLINFAADHSIASRFDYSYDLLGQVISIGTLDGAWTYSYDAAGQLMRAIFSSTNPGIPNQDLAYNYDPAGNRTSTIINGITTNYLANALNEYTSVGGVTQQYDADGNLLFDGTNTYTYNQLDELTSVTGPSGTAQYTYDALGERIAQTAGGQTTQYLIDPAGLGNVVSTYSGTGALVAHFNYGLALVSQTTAAGQSYFYQFDTTGSTVGLSDSTGQDVNTDRYLPFGQILTATTTVANPFQYVGALGVQTDSNGLNFMRARYFQPPTGRFTSSDPLQLLGGDTNFYRYAGNQPVQFVDPSGGTRVAFSYGSLGIDYTVQDTYILFNAVYGSADPAENQYSQVGLSLRKAGGSDNITGPGYLYYYFGAGHGFVYTGQKSSGDFPSQPKYNVGTLRQGVRTNKNSFDYPYPTQPTTTTTSQVAASFDPNDKIGPGFGPSGYVAADSALPYRIDFENDPSATAPAQQVVITDQLSSNVDWNSFRITEIGWGDTVIAVPPNEQHFQTTVSMTFNGMTFNVLVQVGINLATGLITAQFFSIDPTTDLPPDVLTGFLPPEDGTGRGMGYVSYTVNPKTGLSTGTQIRNVANVSFDEEQIVATDQVNDEDPTQGVDPNKQALVTIDAGAPTSSVTALPAHEVSPFTVSWSGQDDAGGSGIASYNVFVSDNGGPYTPFENNTPLTSATFSGQIGHTYGFYSVATDNVGNLEAAPVSPDATTQVTVIRGDVNQDGMVNVADISALMNLLSGGSISNPNLQAAADVDNSGQVNNLDLQALISFLANNSMGGGGGSNAALAVPTTGGTISTVDAGGGALPSMNGVGEASSALATLATDIQSLMPAITVAPAATNEIILPTNVSSVIGSGKLPLAPDSSAVSATVQLEPATSIENESVNWSAITDTAGNESQNHSTTSPVDSAAAKTLGLPPTLPLRAADDFYAAFEFRQAALWETRVGRQGSGESDLTNDLWEGFHSDDVDSQVLLI